MRRRWLYYKYNPLIVLFSYTSQMKFLDLWKEDDRVCMFLVATKHLTYS
jgi:hypothetical protein